MAKKHNLIPTLGGIQSFHLGTTRGKIVSRISKHLENMETAIKSCFLGAPLIYLSTQYKEFLSIHFKFNIIALAFAENSKHIIITSHKLKKVQSTYDYTPQTYANRLP